MDKYKIAYVFLFLLIGFNKISAQPDTVKVGLFVTSLYNFEIKDKSFNTDFWLWFNYTNDSLVFENNVEIANAKSTEFKMFSHEKKSDINWDTEKCLSVIKADWNISNFPFDTQKLTIEIEDAFNDTSALIYIADTVNSRIDDNIDLTEWKILKFTTKSICKKYNTTYGDPELSDVSVYPGVTAEIIMKRANRWIVFFKIFTGVFVAFLISVFVFFIKPINIDPRFGLCVGGLFAAVGNKYVIEANISSIATNNLIDTIHNITFVSILLITALSILSLYIFEKGDEKHQIISRKIDKTSFYAISAAYIISNTVAVLMSLYS